MLDPPWNVGYWECGVGGSASHSSKTQRAGAATVGEQRRQTPVRVSQKVRHSVPVTLMLASHYTVDSMIYRRLLLTSLLLTVCIAGQEQPIEPRERDAARTILSDVRNDLLQVYYDPKFHGVDLDTRYKEALERINKATSLNQTFGVIAWFVEGLHDSHTLFIPPPRPFTIERGWRMQMVGDSCYVTAVKPGSDAEKQGLTPGDRILTINGLTPTRTDLRKIEYLFGTLRPQPGLELKVRDPSQKERMIDVAFQIRETHRVVDIRDFGESMSTLKARWLHERRSAKLGDVIVWKFPNFEVDEEAADDIVRASKQYKSMVVDLRGNPGGSVDTLQHFIGHFLDHEIKVFDVQKRKKTEPELSKPRKPNFTGPLVVLIDSESASASEIFARVMQLEKRGTIWGDRSAGAVMEAEFIPHDRGPIRAIFFGTEITRANVIMKDGRSLENEGVSPDIEVLPTADDLHNNCDPVLARALESLGQKISPEAAGKLFPVQWPEK